MSTTLLALDTLLLQETGDYITGTVSTAISNTTSVVANVTFPEIRSTADYFNNFWVYFDDYTNLGEERLIADDDGSNTLTVLGGVLNSDTANLATFRLSKYSKFSERARAITMAVEEMYPNIYSALDDRSLVTGNIAPPFRWNTTSNMDFYYTANSTITKTSTAGYTRGFGDTALITATAANGEILLTSDQYPRLLDLMGKTVDVKCWAYPSTANDFSLILYTLKADSTAQTLTSTTTCPASAWTSIELRNQALNDDLVKVELKMRVTTNAATAYVTKPILTGSNVYEYLLPNDFDNGSINEIYIQTSGEAAEPVDDLHPRFYNKIYGWEIIDDGTYKYLRLPYLLATPYQIRLLGRKPIAAVSSGTDTIPLETHNLRPLIHYAAFKLFDVKSTRVSSEDKDRYKEMAMYHYGHYSRLIGSHSQVQPSPQLNIRM